MISYDLSNVSIVLVITGRFARDVAMTGDDVGVFRGAGAPFTLSLSIAVDIFYERTNLEMVLDFVSCFSFKLIRPSISRRSLAEHHSNLISRHFTTASQNRGYNNQLQSDGL